MRKPAARGGKDVPVLDNEDLGPRKVRALGYRKGDFDGVVHHRLRLRSCTFPLDPRHRYWYQPACECKEWAPPVWYSSKAVAKRMHEKHIGGLPPSLTIF